MMFSYVRSVGLHGIIWVQNRVNYVNDTIGGQYIGKLMEECKLKNANPIDKGSRIITEENGAIKDGPFNEGKELVAGYFHIVAADIEEAVTIAKGNPIFKDIPTQIEVHPMMAVGGS